MDDKRARKQRERKMGAGWGDQRGRAKRKVGRPKEGAMGRTESATEKRTRRTTRGDARQKRKDHGTRKRPTEEVD